MLYSSDMTEDTRMSAIKGTYRPLKVLDHEFLGRVHILQHYATSQLLIMKERTANNKDHFREEEALIEKRAALRHPNVMILKDWSMKKESKLCAEFFILRTFFQYYIENVELIARKKTKEDQAFDDIELVQLVYDGIDALAYLQSQGYSHGFLRPELIMKDERKSFVICDRLLEGTAIDAHRYARTSNFDLYCSPEVWNNVCNNKSHPSVGYLDDAFSFGLILLRAANLQSPKEIYLQSGIIDQNKLNTLIERAASRYDHIILFRQVLEKLLSIDPKARTDATAIKAGLPNRQQIQMFFNSETEDLYFDGPKSQMHNTMLGRESVLPVPQKNQSIMLGRSSAGDRSNYLAGLNNSITTKPYNTQKDAIFSQGNVIPQQNPGQQGWNGAGGAQFNSSPQYSNPGQYNSSTQYSNPAQYNRPAPAGNGIPASNPYGSQGLNNSQPMGQPYAYPQMIQNQASPQPIARPVYQQPSTNLVANQMIPAANPRPQPAPLQAGVGQGQPSANYSGQYQGQQAYQQSPLTANNNLARGAGGYTGSNPFVAGPAQNAGGYQGGSPAQAAVSSSQYSTPSSYQASSQANGGVRAGPVSAQLQAQTAGQVRADAPRPPIQSPSPLAGQGGAGPVTGGPNSRQSNYMNSDPNMIAQPKTGNKFAPL